MIINGKINRTIVTGEVGIVEFRIPLHHVKRIDDLDKETLYSLNIQKASSKKSLNQNKTAWLIMNDIAREEDVFPDVEKVYVHLLKMSKIKTMWLTVVDENFIDEKDYEEGMREITDEYLVKQLKTIYRVVIIHKRMKNEKGNNVSIVEVALGMSSFDKEKMQRFIGNLLFYAERVGVDTSQYDFERY